MTNNQRFLAEIAVLLTIGGAIWAKAAPQQNDKSATPEVIRAQRFELVDKDGQAYGMLGIGNGKLFGINTKDTKMTLFGLLARQKKNGIPKAGAAFGVTDDGEVFFTLMNTSTKNTILLRVLSDGTTSITLAGKGDKFRVIQP